MASTRAEIVPVFVFHRAWLIAGAFVVISLGLAILNWAVLRPQAAASKQTVVTSGPLRPALVVVPVPGGSLAISEREIGQAELVRGLRALPPLAATSTGAPQTCPTAWRPTAAATCVSGAEIARYANALTARENEVRGAALTDCYALYPVLTFRKGCTGFRLPTLAEWQFQMSKPKGGDAQTRQYPKPFSGSGRQIVSDSEGDQLLYVDGESPRPLSNRDPTAHFRVVRDFR